MAEKLTDRQREVFDYIRRTIRSEGRSPTLREIADHFGYPSPKAATDHLDSLERKGYITRLPTSARNIKVREELSPHGIPVIREVGEDGTLLVPDNIEACLCLPSTFGAAGDIFVVSVPDDAMRNAGIREGDYAVVERAGKVQDGELAAVARDGRPLVRRVFAGQGLALRLAADDSEYEDVVVERDGEGTRILGPVRGLLRAF